MTKGFLTPTVEIVIRDFREIAIRPSSVNRVYECTYLQTKLNSQCIRNRGSEKVALPHHGNV